MKIVIRNHRDEEKGTIELDMNEIGHEICMGIRHGLYGAHCQEDVNIDHPFMECAKGLSDIAEALNRIADNLEGRKI